VISNEVSNNSSNSELNELIVDRNSLEELKEDGKIGYNQAIKNFSKEFTTSEQTPNILPTAEELKEELTEYKKRKKRHYQRNNEEPVILYN
jgi:hypothetical protein